MITAIMGLIGGLLYPLFSIIFLVIDLLQGVFFGLAGVGDIGFNKSGSNHVNDWFGSGTTITAPNGGDGGETSTGLIYYLLTSDLIKNLFLSIMLLAVFLIIIFTAMAFIKNAYASKQKTWQEIVGNAFKGLANFIFIPVCCLLGIWLSNILLLAINGATSTGGATQMSRKLFICCAYDANEYRNKTEVDDKDIEDIGALVEKYSDVEVDFDENHEKNDVEYFANIVDTIYAQSNVSIWKWTSVESHYSLFNFNYLTLIVGGVFMLYVLVSVAYAMIKRMFILLMLFVISPAICAMYPLDEGSAVGSWKKEFIKYTIAAYGAVAGMNLFFSILPIVENINIVSGGGVFLNEIFQLLIMVSGLFVVKEFMGTLSGWIGADNAMASGEGLMKSTTSAVKKYAKGAVKTTGAFAKGLGKAKAAANMAKENGKSGFGAGLGSLIGQGFGALDKGLLGGEVGKLVGNKKKGEKSAFASGMAEEEKSQREAAFKDATKESKKEAQADLDSGKLMMDAMQKAGSEGLTGQDQTSEAFRQVVDKLKGAGFDEQEALLMAGKESRGGKSVKDLQTEYKAATKKHDENEKEKDREKDAAANAAAYEKMGSAIAEKLSEKLGSMPPSTRPAGETRAEETKREREESAYLKAIADHMAQLVAIEQSDGGDHANANFEKAVQNLMSNMGSVGGANSGFAKQVGKIVGNGEELTVDKINGNTQVAQANFDSIKPQIDTYNAALADKKAAEEMAKEATKTFVEEMKKATAGNNDAVKAVEKFEKAADQSAQAVQKLAKEIEEILKKK